ncbi:molecular chaperone [Stenotrophomonas maltophilia]|uniref:fimbrial biogenesis chaperone n=1 Tax=Stenotrophomonas maltophilia TaxID=40324 RepID=UPI000C2671C3|nr:fimbria/pilus periplasmic chaperone [Stenotrophomonas maltophilia]MDH1687273.1 fimbria/pilus periplasmic chaperone [Stenotrophomonas maltophilia]PJL42985.1 molecular chaperone [Stenotrophomonas maltophilia]PZS62082.1 molecular chaperone [Stenotrophomonas maltophilia]HEL3209020.1 fimbria/pilus periplasmic chaperone [Stenotrophomonas maltophilia]HEL4857519.1 fimbria/pilus periplasmic chaperone [Stenotrophomonas maltophilia]
MKLRPSLWLPPLLATALVLPAQAAVTLQGTRIVHDASKGRDVTVKASNVGELPAMTQVWIDAGDSHARPENVRTPFRLTPSEPRLLQAKQAQAYRITYAPRPSEPPLPTDRESVFYFNLLDIPPKPANSGDRNLLQFAVRTRVKLFHRPEGLPGQARDAPGQLQWRMAAGALHVSNPTAYHVTLASLTLPDGSSVQTDMIAPGAQVRLPLPAGASVPTSLTFQWLDDYGSTRDTQAKVIH